MDNLISTTAYSDKEKKDFEVQLFDMQHVTQGSIARIMADKTKRASAIKSISYYLTIPMSEHLYSTIGDKGLALLKNATVDVLLEILQYINLNLDSLLIYDTHVINQVQTQVINKDFWSSLTNLFDKIINPSNTYESYLLIALIGSDPNIRFVKQLFLLYLRDKKIKKIKIEEKKLKDLINVSKNLGNFLTIEKTITQIITRFEDSLELAVLPVDPTVQHVWDETHPPVTPPQAAQAVVQPNQVANAPVQQGGQAAANPVLGAQPPAVPVNNVQQAAQNQPVNAQIQPVNAQVPPQQNAIPVAPIVQNTPNQVQNGRLNNPQVFAPDVSQVPNLLQPEIKVIGDEIYKLVFSFRPEIGMSIKDEGLRDYLNELIDEILSRFKLILKSKNLTEISEILTEILLFLDKLYTLLNSSRLNLAVQNKISIGDGKLIIESVFENIRNTIIAIKNNRNITGQSLVVPLSSAANMDNTRIGIDYLNDDSTRQPGSDATRQPHSDATRQGNIRTEVDLSNVPKEYRARVEILGANINKLVNYFRNEVLFFSTKDRQMIDEIDSDLQLIIQHFDLSTLAHLLIRIYSNINTSIDLLNKDEDEEAITFTRNLLQFILIFRDSI